jgi:hypothetical protein
VQLTHACNDDDDNDDDNDDALSLQCFFNVMMVVTLFEHSDNTAMTQGNK